MGKLFMLNVINGNEKRTVSASEDYETVMKYLQEHQYLAVPDNTGNGFEVVELLYDEIGNAKTSLMFSQVKKGSEAKFKLVKGKTYNLVVGMHMGAVSDVAYLSNMVCVDVNENGYTIQGLPGTIGSLHERIFVYKDEVFYVFDEDLFECVSHRP